MRTPVFGSGRTKSVTLIHTEESDPVLNIQACRNLVFGRYPGIGYNMTNGSGAYSADPSAEGI